jgi:hypothetical protein
VVEPFPCSRFLRTRLPLFLAVFIDIFSFGLMYPLIVGMFHSGWVPQVYSPAWRDIFLSLVVTLITLWAATFAGDVPKRKFEFDWREPFLLFWRMRSRPALIPPVSAFFLFQFGYVVYYTFILIEMQRRYGCTTAETCSFCRRSLRRDA